MSLFKTIKDSLGNIIYPATHARAVFIEKSDGTITNLQDFVTEDVIEAIEAPSVPVDPTSSEVENLPEGAIWIVTE